MKCRNCNELSGMLVRMNMEKSWENIEYCRGCAFSLFKGHDTLQSGDSIGYDKAEYTVIEIYTEEKKYEPLKLIL